MTDHILPHNGAADNPATNTGRTLDELAAKARQHYGRHVESWLATAYVLQEAHGIVRHGEWTPFLERAGVPGRTARRMLRFADAEVQTGHVASLGGIAATDVWLAAMDRARSNHAAWQADLERCGSSDFPNPAPGTCPILVCFWQVSMSDWYEALKTDGAPAPVMSFATFIEATPFWPAWKAAFGAAEGLEDRGTGMGGTATKR